MHRRPTKRKKNGGGDGPAAGCPVAAPTKILRETIYRRTIRGCTLDTCKSRTKWPKNRTDFKRKPRRMIFVRSLSNPDKNLSLETNHSSHRHRHPHCHRHRINSKNKNIIRNKRSRKNRMGNKHHHQNHHQKKKNNTVRVIMLQEIMIQKMTILLPPKRRRRIPMTERADAKARKREQEPKILVEKIPRLLPRNAPATTAPTATIRNDEYIVLIFELRLNQIVVMALLHG
mmetsp:Transcript_25995/g.54397  ORF Transcript_25995/g.54397 Transcript_25995/m.54397 type:complete len:230 (+) Transcript_25995:1824-2513(+)